MDSYAYEQQIWKRVLSGRDGSGPQTHEQTVMQALEQTRAAQCCYAALSRRTGGACRAQLNRLCQEKGRQVQQLEAVYYLLTGQRAGLSPGGSDGQGTLCGLLRERFHAELRAGTLYADAAERYAPFSGLYISLSRESARAAEQLRCLIQSLL